MSKQTLTLRDDRHRIIGYVEIDDEGNKELRDDRHRIKGYYEGKNDITRDDRHRRIGYGDILTSLL